MGQDAAAAGGAKPKTGISRMALTQTQTDMIKDGAMISRARCGHPS